MYYFEASTFSNFYINIEDFGLEQSLYKTSIFGCVINEITAKILLGFIIII